MKEREITVMRKKTLLKKKDLIELFLIGVCIFGMTFYMTGCSNEKTNSDSINMVGGEVNDGMEESPNNNEQNEDYRSKSTSIKVSDLFKDEFRIWYRILDSTISYDEEVHEVFICKNGNITSYGWSNTLVDPCPRLEDFDGLQDEEIITYIEKKLGETPHKEFVHFSYTRDGSGNDIKTETLEFEHSSRKIFDIGSMLKPVTILSNQFFGITTEDGGMSLITKYNFEEDTNIVLNEIGDEEIVER